MTGRRAWLPGTVSTMTDRHGEESRPEEQKPETAAPFSQEVTDQELLDRRAEILRSVGKTYEELVALARTGSLTADRPRVAGLG